MAVVTQPSFIFFHGDRYRQTVPPEHLPDLYPLGALAAAGVRVAASSDCPVVPARPLLGMAAAVSRRAEDDGCLGPEQGVGAAWALRMHTSDAAWVLGLERSIGSVAAGKRADLLALSADPLTTPPEGLAGIQLGLTLIGGEVVGAIPG